ncbi:substrate-binding periplasmic protein [Oxalobacteraceae bacterium A2-2]
MASRRFLTLGRAVLLGALVSCMAPATAGGCTREIVVPVSANGMSVSTDGGTVRGIYPDLLRSLGAKHGCSFSFPIVPRARQLAMFETGAADLLLPSSPTEKRDRIGVFVPMIGHRAVVIGTGALQPIASFQDLLARRGLRVAVVRGFDYGGDYEALLKRLADQGRLYVEVDVKAVARLLHSGAADVTIMGPPLMEGAIRNEPRVAGLLDKLRFYPIPEIPWSHSGIYVSRSSLPAADQALLRDMLERAARSGVVLDGYQRLFGREVLSSSVRGR